MLTGLTLESLQKALPALAVLVFVVASVTVMIFRIVIRRWDFELFTPDPVVTVRSTQGPEEKAPKMYDVYVGGWMEEATMMSPRSPWDGVLSTQPSVRVSVLVRMPSPDSRTRAKDEGPDSAMPHVELGVACLDRVASRGGPTIYIMP
ncbi:hypothetical protein C8Q80DRAFT_1123859 [Daedaleopsis nitida]|nr:hypothetical protein C8Q80DRAFT_1123859 [Daedaleopsis nitida]